MKGRVTMKVRFLSVVLALTLLLSGCSLFDGSYVSVTPYQQQPDTGQSEAISAKNYFQLRSALEKLVDAGMESSVIYIADYNRDLVERNLDEALRYIQEAYPVGAYALESVDYEIGTGSGKPAVALDFQYRRSRVEIRRIRDVKDLERAKSAIGDALKNFDTVLAIEIAEYEEADFIQFVEDYAEEHPEFVIEVPLVAVDVYGSGKARVVEFGFSYQTNRDSLKHMKTQVQPIFDSAALYVSSAADDRQKYSQLYSFLMERFDYALETSITPAYSLLCHGVGDSRAFALTYASMCRRAGLDCRIVTGTRNGEPWTWNMVLDNGSYFHVDLLRCSLIGRYDELTDLEMNGYVWDYSAYPESVAPYTPPEEPSQGRDPEPQATQPVTHPVEETEPESEPET